MPNDLNKLSKSQLIALVLQLVKQNEQLTSKVEQLQDRLARLEKNSSNSSKPPSSDIVDPQPEGKKKCKRKVGGQRGHKKHTRQPFSPNEIDKTIVHCLPQEVVKRRGLVPINETESALQQIDLPKKHFSVTEHRAQLYHRPNGDIVKAKLPAHIRKYGLFSPRLTALTGYLKARGHMSYSTLQAYFKDIMNLDITQSYLAKVCTKNFLSRCSPRTPKWPHIFVAPTSSARTRPATKTPRSNQRGHGVNKHPMLCYFISATHVDQRFLSIFLVLNSRAPLFVITFQPTRSLSTTTISPFSSASRI